MELLFLSPDAKHCTIIKPLSVVFSSLPRPLFETELRVSLAATQVSVCSDLRQRERDGSGPGAPSKLDPDRSDTRGIWAKRAKLLGPARRATSDNGGASGTHDRATASGDYRRGVTVWVITAESKLDLTCFPIFFSPSYYFFLRKRKSFIYYSEVGLQS